MRLGRAFPAILVSLPLVAALALPTGALGQGSDLAASLVGDSAGAYQALVEEGWRQQVLIGQ